MPTVETLPERIQRLRDSSAYQTYQFVLERVLRMKELAASQPDVVYHPSDYWEEELAELFDYLLDASPLIVEKLRQHCHHITGIRVYDYRSGRIDSRRRFAEKLQALVELGGPELLVPESPLLGGFGFEIDGALYNIDTLKFYEVLIAMQRGAILDEFRQAEERRIVWEIGSGWGGFAYQFKQLCPNTTYVISDFPELFLFSAVYLMTHFPEARFSFFGVDPAGLAVPWTEADFVFVPNTSLPDFRPPHLDLTINMVSFQEMTSEQVQAYVRHAFELGSPYLYSLNRDRSPYNAQLTSVSEIIGGWYWPHEIPVLPVSYTKMLDKVLNGKVKKPGKLERRERGWQDYRHIVGWRRVLA